MQTVTTEIEVHDPSAVALAKTDGTPVIPVGGAHVTRTLSRGRVATSESSSASYDLSAIRDDDGTLSVEWTTALPLVDGERNEVIGRKPVVFEKPLSALFSESMLEAPAFVFPTCATLAYRGVRFARWRSEGRAAPEDCVGETVVPYRLETPWDNVVIHEKTRVMHDLAWMTIGLSVVTLTPFAIIVDATPSKGVTGGDPTKVGFTIGIAAAVGAFIAAIIPTLFAKDRDVYARKGRPKG